MVDDGDDDSTVDELECDLNQLCKAWPNLTSENLDADGLIDFDREVATNESRSMPVGEIVNENLPQPMNSLKMAAVMRMRFMMNSYHHHMEIKLTRRLTLFTTDLDLDTLLVKVSNKINQRRLDKMKQSSISDFLKKTVTTVFWFSYFCKC